ncbi:Alcohol dehydrogenase-like 1 [Vitis vinifera]|uniref:Alcohol dehydrogenase-like 1 n=1 Tax=Vitis vinifera TaxID=29760 RepID=A0A438G0S6_VITVI|nr:Alcohol dehydrogenase-like 1 [Vitis vinifera]
MSVSSRLSPGQSDIPTNAAARANEVITCKAAVCWGLGEAMKVEEIQVEPPKSSEVRVKMLYASICHTDIFYCSELSLPMFPKVPGHEGVGVVESVGENVTGLKEGDVVIPTYLGECGECENCRSPKTNVCLKHPVTFTGLMPDGTSRMSIRGQRLHHIFSCSTWTEYMVVNANYLVKIDPRIAPSDASFLSCGFPLDMGQLGRTPRLKKDQVLQFWVLVLQGARNQGAARIIGIDKNEKRREVGEAFGMTDFINPNESNKSISELVNELTGGQGVDYSFECTGIPSLVNEALQATKVGKGMSMVLGIANVPTVDISLMALLSGKTLKGCFFGGIKVQSDIPRVSSFPQDIQLDELLTHEVQLEDMNKAFELLKQPDCVKVLIKI